MKIGIVTGASSGLGREFVRQVSEQEGLAEIWVIARREERLRQLQEEVRTPLRVLALDLTKEESLQKLQALLEREKPDLRLLVNAAGFGKMGNYDEIAEQDCSDMVDLNCRAAVEVTVLSLPYMQKGARILEIASCSAFQPLPGLSLYAATKAFLLRYSRGLRWELFARHIHVTAVCPYWVKDTEFIPRARDSKNGKAVRHFPLASRAHSVVKWALADSRLNFAVSTPSPVAFLHRIAAKFVPHCVMIAGWEGLRRL